MRKPAPILAFLLFLAACAADGGEASMGAGGAGGAIEAPPPYVPGAPLADAGPDQRVLPGVLVRLDGRGSQPGEEGLPIAWLWTQEAGPRVRVDSPNAPVAHFVAPPFRPGEGARLVFRLTIDDGRRRVHDRVVIELVDLPAAAIPAPVALAGSDLEVSPGAAVVLAPPRTLDPGCTRDGLQPGCESAGVRFRWTQVEGPAVELSDSAGEATFSAPSHEATLTFRLDAWRDADDAEGRCGPEGEPDSRSFCAAPDYLRIHVRRRTRLDQPPTARLSRSPDLGGAALLLRLDELPSNAHPDQFQLVGVPADAEAGPIVRYRYRPLLGELPLGSLETQVLDLPRPAGPATVGVAFEAQAGRLVSAPSPLLIAWDAPADRKIPLADAGGCTEGISCPPLPEGTQVVLDGSGSSDADTPSDELEYCWQQTLGPRVHFVEGDGCLVGEPRRTFTLPSFDPAASELAFELVVRDGGPIGSRPATRVIRVRPFGVEPPVPHVAAPEEVEERATVRLDASGSFDPAGGRLRRHFRQIRLPGTPQVELRPDPACGVVGACVQFVAPSVVQNVRLRFELAVVDEGGLVSTRPFEMLVRNSTNEPPSAEAGPDRVTAAGRVVEVRGVGSDPNPDDLPLLAFAWELVEGSVDLTEVEPGVARFVAPTSSSDHDVVLRLTVRDPAGDVAEDEVRITILAEGPWVANVQAEEPTGSRHAPLPSVREGLELAAELGLPRVHLSTGVHELDDEEERLVVASREIRGGHDPSLDWQRTTEHSILRAERAIELGDGGALSQIEVVHVGSEDVALSISGEALAEGILVDGNSLTGIRTAAIRTSARLTLIDSFVRGASSSSPAAQHAAIRCDAGLLDVRESEIEGGAGGGRHTGIVVESGCAASLSRTWVEGGAASDQSRALMARGATRVENSILFAGPSPNVDTIDATAGIAIHSSLVAVRGLDGGPMATAIRAASNLSVRNSLVDGGGLHVDRAHIRATAAPTALDGVLFVPDAACGGTVSHLQIGAAAPACTRAEIEGRGIDFSVVVEEPLLTSADDLRPLPSSPCVDAGTATQAPAVDFDGRPRGGDGNGDGVDGFDIGPYER